MRYFCWVFPVFLLAALLPLPSGPEAKPGMRALIIAIGDYPRTGGWSKLSSARDAVLLEGALKSQGFNDITTLVDKEATKQQILDALDKLQHRIKAGDIVYLHFSGHGQQVWDHDSKKFPERKKDETDGFDESLVPYDARDEFREGVYEGENHITDDELHLLLTGLRQKIGSDGQLIFSVDACYSGSISRAAALLPVRGTSKRFSPETVGLGLSQPAASGAFSETFSVTGKERLSDLIIFSAARADQPNYETHDPSGQAVGSLSYAISRNLMQPFAEAPSFSNFFRHVEAEMAKLAPYQSPQLEGNGEKALFGNMIIPVPGFPVEAVINAQQITARGGQLAGLQEGTQVRLRPAAATERGEGIPGKVTASELTSSTIELEQPLPEGNPADWVVTVESKMLSFSPVQITAEVENETLLDLIRKQAGESERISLVETGAQIVITQATAGAPLELSDLEGELLGRYPTDTGSQEAVEKLFQRIRTFTRAQYFRQFSAQALEKSPEVEIMPVPVSIEQKGDRYVVRSRQEEALRVDRDVQTLEIGTPFIFKVTNRSSSPLYLSIIGIDAADEVFLLLPDPLTPPAEFAIAADTTVYFNRPEYIFTISEPAGKQIFLAFASFQPVDLQPVFRYAQSGQSGLTRSELSPQSSLLNELLFGETRSGTLPGREFMISAVVVDIPEKR